MTVLLDEAVSRIHSLRFGKKMFIMLICTVACQTNQFTCDNGLCMSLKDVCDYFDNCGDKSDERGCSYPPRKLCVLSILTCNCTLNVHFRTE